MQRINFKIVIRIIGMLLCMEALFMIIPYLVALWYGDGDALAFGITTGITAAAGMLILLITRNCPTHLAKREGFLVVATTWVFFSLFGMLPYLIYGCVSDITHAFFEAISGFTTTGSTLLPDIDSLPHGILFWRAFSQWLGGMGIILFTLAILPMLNSGGGMQLFKAETTGITHSKLSPRIGQTAIRLWGMYVAITLVLAVFLYFGPMDVFDSICHALSTTATGGYSTKQQSIAYWNSAYIDYVIIFFMYLSGINFPLVFLVLSKGQVKSLYRDEEVRWYTIISLLATLAIATGLFMTNQIQGSPEGTVRASLFQVMACITSTGFSTANFNSWGAFYIVILFLVMFFGACAGSTSGGAKTIRFVVLMKNTVNELYRHIHPNAVVPVRINRKIIPYEIVSKTLAFIFVYLMIFIVSSVLLAGMGLPFEEAFGYSLSCLSNLGLEFGQMTAGFAGIPDAGLWLLAFVMLVGRLELFTILILFTPYFWKK
ncbi:MAG: TrkH family potassium uptake protein [Coprobacter sp.]|nr:TrkH family potassium uptake protein [Coprobacter sp.]